MRTATPGKSGLAATTTTAAAALTFALGPAASASTVGWTSDGGGPANTYADEHETGITPETVGTLKERFSIEVPSSIVADPLVVGEKIFVAYDGGLAAYAAEDGRRLWARQASSIPELVWSNGTLYAATGALHSPNKLKAYRPDGSLRWEHTASGVQFHTLVAADGTVAVSGTNRGGEARKVVAYREDGTFAWSKKGHTIAENSSVVDAEGQIYLRPADGASPEEKTVAVALGSGKTRWTVDKAVQPRAAVGGRDTVVAMADKGVVTHRLQSLSTDDGDTRWNVPTSDYAAAHEMAVDGERAYLAEHHDDALTARDLDTGELRWSTAVPARADLTHPVVAGGLVYLVTADASDRALSAFRADNGAKVWSHPIGGSGYGQHPVVADGRLYFREGDTVRVFGPDR